jgi:ribosomal protein S18 acetylase RimI-like enzyme
MLRIIPATSTEDIAHVQELFREYAHIPGVAPCVEDFEREVASLPGLYAPPGGTLLLALEDGSGVIPQSAVGCVGLRRWDERSCEMKRLFVRPEFRDCGAGCALVNEVIAAARSVGYQRMLLDTLPSMQKAQELYRSLGFREIPPYPKQPIPGALCFELDLSVKSGTAGGSSTTGPRS